MSGGTEGKDVLRIRKEKGAVQLPAHAEGARSNLAPSSSD